MTLRKLIDTWLKKEKLPAYIVGAQLDFMPIIMLLPTQWPDSSQALPPWCVYIMDDRVQLTKDDQVDKILHLGNPQFFDELRTFLSQ